jgi:hypothetical protein
MIRSPHALLLSFVPILISVSGLTVSFAQTVLDKRVEFACGTDIIGGAWFAEAGRIACEDDVGGAKTELGSKDKNIFCFYNATCTPVTKEVRRFIVAAHNERAKKPVESYSELNDDQINQTLFAIARTNPVLAAKTSVQCVGVRKADGAPECPKVNDCVNNRKVSSLFFHMQPLNVKMVPTPEDSFGFGIQKTGDDAPKGVRK